MPIICATRSGFGLMVAQQNRGLRPCLFYAAPLGLVVSVIAYARNWNKILKKIYKKLIFRIL